MKIKLVARKIRPSGVPVTLIIKPTVLEGTDAAAVVQAIKVEFAQNIIPHSRLFAKQCNAMRANVLAMSNAEVEAMLFGYLKLPLPKSDAAAITELATEGFLTILEP